MVKKLYIVCLFITSVSAQDIFERNCIPCHQSLPASLHDMFKRYLLTYSSETNMKAGIKHFLRYPSKDISNMSDLFVDNFGVKKKTTLSTEELDKAVDIYWERYKVFGKLK
ncbi:MAG: hypothetical protein L3J43_11140 [Sulfurovum sp.]|nr:hypothetical protein [Sulfurovum sp.]